MASTLRERPPDRDWVDAYDNGSALSTGQAAHICDCSDDTIRRWAETAADAGQPIGILIAGVWVIDLQRLLNAVERRRDLHARRVAESRAKKNAELRSSLQNRLSSASDAAIAAP
jgi:hypothetical protein